MSDVYAIFGTLLALGIAFPGMLTAFWLLFPAIVEKTETRIESAPWKSFWFGIGAAIAIGIPVVVLMNLSLGILQFIGFLPDTIMKRKPPCPRRTSELVLSS